MRFSIQRTVGLGDASITGELTPSATLAMLQDVALAHCASVGFPFKWSRQQGFVWVFAQTSCVFHTPVRLDDAVDITTWSRGIDGVRGYREFLITRDSELVTSASSLFIYVDIGRLRPARVPNEVAERFSPEPQRALDEGTFVEPTGPWDAELAARVSIGYRDIDINGHVNSAAYPSFIQTALFRELGITAGFRTFTITYKREIPAATQSVDLLLCRRAAGFRYEVRGEALHAEGVFTLASDDSAYARDRL